MTKRRRVDPADLEKVVSIHEALSRDLAEAEAQLKRAGCVVAELERERAVLLKYLPLSSNDKQEGTAVTEPEHTEIVSVDTGETQGYDDEQAGADAAADSTTE